MHTMETDRLIDDYLRRLEHAAAHMQRARRTELVAEIRGHIETALDQEQAAGEAAVRNVLDRLGPPEEIVQAAEPPSLSGDRRAGVLEILALLALIVPLIGWLIGTVLGLCLPGMVPPGQGGWRNPVDSARLGSEPWLRRCRPEWERGIHAAWRDPLRGREGRGHDCIRTHGTCLLRGWSTECAVPGMAIAPGPGQQSQGLLNNGRVPLPSWSSVGRSGGYGIRVGSHRRVCCLVLADRLMELGTDLA
jgi:hypothetical protein